MVDTLGLLLAVLITSAGLDDGVAAPLLLGHVTPHDFPRLVTIFADQKYHNHTLDAWMAEHRAGWRIEITVRPESTKGFTPLAKRWVIERTNAWHGRYRRNSKDYERSTASSTAMIRISNMHLKLNESVFAIVRIAYRKDAACSRGNSAKSFPDSLLAGITYQAGLQERPPMRANHHGCSRRSLECAQIRDSHRNSQR